MPTKCFIVLPQLYDDEGWGYEWGYEWFAVPPMVGDELTVKSKDTSHYLKVVKRSMDSGLTEDLVTLDCTCKQLLYLAECITKDESKRELGRVEVQLRELERHESPKRKGRFSDH